MQNLKTSTKIFLIVLSIVAISSAVGLFVSYKTETVAETIKASILHNSVENAQNQGHFILTPPEEEVFDKTHEEEKAVTPELEHQEAPNYLARP